MEIFVLKKTSIHTKTKEMKVNPDYFTGKAILQELSSIVKSQEQKIFHVTFQNGARTKLHTHGSIDKHKVFSHIAINANASINKDAKTTWYESDFKTKATKILV